MRLPTILSSAVALAAVISLSGCATGGAAGGPAAALDPAAKVTGEVTVWSWDTAAAGLKRLAESYEKTHEGTSITVVDVGYDNAYDKLSVGLQAGSGLPDLVTIETDRAPGFIAEFPSGFTNLSPVLGEHETDFDPSKWWAGSNTDGELMAAPWDSGTVALFYRSDYFADAGIDPASIDTWDDLVSAGEQIKETTGHTLMSIDVASGSTFTMLLQQAGQGLFNEDGEIAITSPAAVEALTLLKTMNEKGLLKNVKGWDGRVTATKDGDSAVHPEAVWWIGTLTAEMPELSGAFGVVELPALGDGSARTSNNGGSNLAIPSQAKNPDLAASFLAYALADADNQVSLMQNEGLFPSYLPALQDEFFQREDPYFSGQKVYQLFAEQTAQIPSVVYTSDNAKALDIVANAVVAAVINGAEPKKTLEDAADQIATATGRDIAN